MLASSLLLQIDASLDSEPTLPSWYLTRHPGISMSNRNHAQNDFGRPTFTPSREGESLQAIKLLLPLAHVEVRCWKLYRGIGCMVEEVLT
jgi:hypothetical protein